STITAPKPPSTSRPHILIVTGAPRPSHPVVRSKAGGACSCGREPLEDSDVLQDREVHERSHEYLGSEGTACMAHRRHGTDRNARRVCSHIETARHNRVAAMGGACLRDVLELQRGASALALGHGDVAYPETNADRRSLVGDQLENSSVRGSRDDRAHEPDTRDDRHPDSHPVGGAAVDLDREIEIGRRRGDDLCEDLRNPVGKGKSLFCAQLVELLLSLLGLDELATELADLELQALVLRQRAAVVDDPGEQVSHRMQHRRDPPLHRRQHVGSTVADCSDGPTRFALVGNGDHRDRSEKQDDQRETLAGVAARSCHRDPEGQRLVEEMRTCLSASNSSRHMPLLKATQLSGSGATTIGMWVSICSLESRPCSRAPPPVSTMPCSMMSAASSGGVRSKVTFTASTMAATGSSMALRISSVVVTTVFGRPVTRSRPRISAWSSSSSSQADP